MEKEKKKRVKLTDKIAVSLCKGQIKQHLSNFFRIYNAFLDSWKNAGCIESFEDYIEKAKKDFDNDSDYVINKMLGN